MLLDALAVLYALLLSGLAWLWPVLRDGVLAPLVAYVVVPFVCVGILGYATAALAWVAARSPGPIRAWLEDRKRRSDLAEVLAAAQRGAQDLFLSGRAMTREGVHAYLATTYRDALSRLAPSDAALSAIANSGLTEARKSLAAAGHTLPELPGVEEAAAKLAAEMVSTPGVPAPASPIDLSAVGEAVAKNLMERATTATGFRPPGT